MYTNNSDGIYLDFIMNFSKYFGLIWIIMQVFIGKEIICWIDAQNYLVHSFIKESGLQFKSFLVKSLNLNNENLYVLYQLYFIILNFNLYVFNSNQQIKYLFQQILKSLFPHAHLQYQDNSFKNYYQNMECIYVNLAGLYLNFANLHYY